VVLIGAISAVFVWFIRRGVPESPRWLISHGHLEEAERATASMEARVAQELGKPLPPRQSPFGGRSARTLLRHFPATLFKPHKRC